MRVLEALQKRDLGDDVVGLGLAELGFEHALDGDRLAGSGLAVGLVHVAVGAGAEALREGVGGELGIFRLYVLLFLWYDRYDV